VNLNTTEMVILLAFMLFIFILVGYVVVLERHKVTNRRAAYQSCIELPSADPLACGISSGMSRIGN